MLNNLRGIFLIVLLLVFSRFAFTQVNLSQGLIAHYTFNGNANDVSGNNNNPVFNNAVLTTDRFNNANSAYKFNGISSYIQIPNSPTLNTGNTITMAIFIKPTGFYYGTCHGNSILMKGSDINAAAAYRLRFEDENYSNSTNCSYSTPDTVHQNYWGPGTGVAGGYTPYVKKGEWISLIYTYDGINAKLYVNCQLVVNKPSPGYYFNNPHDLFIGKMDHPSFPYWLNGDLDDLRIYNRAINEDEVKSIAETCTLTTCTQKKDFSFIQNTCAPYQFTFSTTSSTYESITWNFGDGNSTTGSPTVSHTYASPGNYAVMMIQKYQNCIDTVRKTFTVSIQNDNQTILTPDTTICFGSKKQLRSAQALSYCWSPISYLDNPSVQNPISSAPGNITYYLTSEKKGNNLIINGDFSTGNTAFTSAYNYAASNITEGQFFVGPSPRAWNASLSNCGDHTTGNGNMMLVNGAPTADVKVWTQTVTVVPNTNYSFGTWIQALWPPNPAQLRFSINNNDVGSLITASLPTCTWTQFYTTWNSGNATTATISIVNKNTLVIGNDFALDDISFTPIIITRDSVKITVDSPKINTSSDSSICIGSPMQISTSGASSYIWSPASGLSNYQIANPIANPTSTTKYVVTGTNSFGCTAQDSITVTVKPNPTIILSNDTLICSGSSLQLSASGGSSYSWSPINSLSNNSISNPIATPVIATTYKVIVTNADNCSSTDSIRVDVKQPGSFTVNPSSQLCVGDSLQLNATGGHIYYWNPTSSLSNNNIANPYAFPTTTTVYDVIITDTLCNNSEVHTTTVAVNPLPILTTSKSNDVDCSTANSYLNVTGAEQYAWTPSGTLNNPRISNPIASPFTTTTYIVSGKDGNGCSNTDSITVLVTANNSGNYLMPNAFTPNNDGLNDCFGIYNWGLVTQLEFSIYNRWGQRVFYTTNPANCWNGNFNAVPQIPGVYSYVISANNACGVIKRNGIVTLVR